MEYNNPSEIVKTLTFGDSARKQLLSGVEQLAGAVKSTLGASGKCVIYEDTMGRPVITKDGVTVAESVVLLHPVENIGATLIKEAARKTVREAGDGTTTSTVLAHDLLKNATENKEQEDTATIKAGIISGTAKVMKYLDKVSVPVKGKMLTNVATISCNNDQELGKLIGSAYEKVGENGVVLMEESETNLDSVEFVEGAQFDSGLKSAHLVTDKDKHIAVLDNPYVLIVSSPIPNIRKIQSVLEHGPTKQDTIEDLAILTGATIINEELGDDLDLIDPEALGVAVKSVTDDKNTVLQVADVDEVIADRIEDVKKKIKEEVNPFFKTKLEQRLSMLTGMVGIIYVGANSKVELKEKKDRVEDAIYATKAAAKEGIVAGGGVALLNASYNLGKPANFGEQLLYESIRAPYYTILENAGIVEAVFNGQAKNKGIDATNGKTVNMVKAGIIDPVLVTKCALKNAVSVVTTIISADCIISNKRLQ